jgi:hypothetical protein
VMQPGVGTTELVVTLENREYDAFLSRTAGHQRPRDGGYFAWRHPTRCRRSYPSVATSWIPMGIGDGK